MTDYTYAFGDSGFILNTDNASTFPFVDITDISGLDNAPIRQSTDEHEGMDGTYVDADFMSMRTIVLTGNLYTAINDPETVCDILKAQYGPGNGIQPFYFKSPSKSLRFVNAQGGGAKYDLDNNRGMGITPIQLTLFAGDPYVYDYPANIDTANFVVPTGIGIGFNMRFNTGFGGTLTLPEVEVTNFGNNTAYPLITLNGPLTNPVIVDSANGISMALSITLASSDTLVIDCRNKTIVLNQISSRRSSYNGIQFPSVPPGTSDSFLLAASAGSGKISVVLYNTYY